MAFTPKILGQVNATTSNTDLYTVPSSTNTVVSTLAINNTTSSTATATVYLRKASAGTPAAAATSNALLSANTIAANSTTFITVGLTMAAADVITVTSGTSGALTFHAFGSELA